MSTGTDSSSPNELLRVGNIAFLILLAATIGLLSHTVSAWLGVGILATVVAVLALRQYQTGHYLVALLFGAFFTHLLIIVVNSQLDLLTQPPISDNHSQHAIQVATGWFHGRFRTALGPSEMRVLVAYILAPFYVVLGPWQVAGELAIAFFGTLIGYPVYKLAREVTSRRVALLATALTVFWPSILYRSVVIQREVLVTIAMLAMLWVALRWTERIRPHEIVLLIVAVAGLFVLRKENLAIVAVTMGVAALTRYRHRPRYLAATVMVGVPVLVYFALNFGDFTGVGTAISPGTLDHYAHARAHGTATYLSNLHYNSWFEVLLYLPLKVIYYLFSPLPWQVNSTTDLLAGLSGWGLLVATALAVTGFSLLGDNSEKRAVIAAYVISGIAAYAVIEMNFGAAFRRRIQFVPVILIFAAIGFVRARRAIKHWHQSRTAEMDAGFPKEL